MRRLPRSLISVVLTICFAIAAFAAVSATEPTLATFRAGASRIVELAEPLTTLATPKWIGRLVRAERLEVVAQAQGGTPRQGQSTTTLADGRVLIAGGDAEGSAEIVDPATGQTTTLDARMSVARAYHGAVRLADGNVLIVGGYAAGSASLEGSAEVFEVSSGSFVKTPTGPKAARVQPTLTLRDDGIVRIVGGDAAASTEYYNPEAQSFGTDPAAPSLITDREDYAPGETVAFIGRGWQPGETVRLALHEVPEQHEVHTLFAVADEAGAFVNTEYAPEEHDLGTTYNVVATGMISGAEATWTFTDAASSSST